MTDFSEDAVARIADECAEGARLAAKEIRDAKVDLKQTEAWFEALLITGRLEVEEDEAHRCFRHSECRDCPDLGAACYEDRFRPKTRAT